MLASVSALRPPRTRRLSLALPDDVRPCLAAFNSTFWDLLTHAPPMHSDSDGHWWFWELPPTSGSSIPSPDGRPSTSNRNLHQSAVETRHCTVIYQPSKVHHQKARDMDHVVTLAALRVGLNSSAYIKRANLVPPALGRGKGKDVLTYVSKVWSRDQVDSWVGFCSELSLYKGTSYLRPLQGVIVPRLLGVYNTDSGFACNMEPPHPVFWFEASAEMPDILKAKIISAYSTLHARGILHGDVALRHILVGGDTRVTIIDFQESRALVGDDAVGLGTATEADLAIEMRRARYVLDFEGARAYENSKTRCEAERRKRNKDLARSTKRCRRAGLPFSHLQPASPPMDDMSNPPLHPEELREWQRSCKFISRRVVVPETSEEQLCAAVSEFVCIVKQLVDGDVAWSLSSESSASNASASPSPSKLGRSSPPPSSSDTTARRSLENLGAAASAVEKLSDAGSEPTGRPKSGHDDVATTTLIDSPLTDVHLVALRNPRTGSIATPTSSSAIKRARDSADDVDARSEASPLKRVRQEK